MPGHHGSHNDILRVDPDAIPGLRGAFEDALTRVDGQLELVEKELRVVSWASDPVSLGATTAFNDRALDSDADAVVDLLRNYREQLDAAVRNLDASAEQYKQMDDDNATDTGTVHQG